MKSYTAFLFDCDGTLVDSEIIAMGIAVNILAEAVKEIKPDVKIDCPQLVQDYAGWHFDKMIEDIGRNHDVRLDEGLLQARKIPETIEALKNVKAVPGIASFLQFLQGRDKAVVTSSEFSRVIPCLETCGLIEFFGADRRFSAHDSLNPPAYKPAPDIYKHALKALNAAAGDAVAFEDSLSGVKAARAACIDVVGIVAGSHIPTSGKADAARDLLAHGAAIVVSHADDLRAALAWLENPGKKASLFKHPVHFKEDGRRIKPGQRLPNMG